MMRERTIKKMATQLLKKHLAKLGVDTSRLTRNEMIERLTELSSRVEDENMDADNVLELFDHEDMSGFEEPSGPDPDEALADELLIAKVLPKVTVRRSGLVVGKNHHIVEVSVADNPKHTQTLIGVTEVSGALFEVAKRATEGDKSALLFLTRTLRAPLTAWAQKHGGVFGPSERSGLGYNSRYQLPDALFTFQVLGTPTTRKIFHVKVLEVIDATASTNTDS